MCTGGGGGPRSEARRRGRGRGGRRRRRRRESHEKLSQPSLSGPPRPSFLPSFLPRHPVVAVVVPLQVEERLQKREAPDGNRSAFLSFPLPGTDTAAAEEPPPFRGPGGGNPPTPPGPSRGVAQLPRCVYRGGRQLLKRAMKSFIPFFILLWNAAGISRAAKIVIVPPIMFESHLYIFKTLASALHEQGHQTVFLLSEGREIPPSNHYRLQRYPGIFNTSTSDEFLQSKMRSIFSGRLTALELFDILDHYSKNCDMIVGNKKLLQALKQEKFDLLLVDPNEMCGFVIAHLLGIKYAVFSTGLWYPAEVGAPAPLAYVPEFNSLLTDHMNLLERLKNTIVYLVSRFGVSFLVLPKYERIMQKYNVQPTRSMYDLVHETSLWMLCTDVALEFPRPTLPNVVYVGGILTKPAGPLPEDLQTWVNGANENGFVLVSFGAGVKYLSEDIANKLAHALARLPQRVIWRFSGNKPKNLGNNTKLIEWLPQNDLLGHSNIKAFLSHGGLNSIFETMYHGVPVVGIPLFGDHYDTMTRVQAKRMGILLNWKTITEDELYNALVKVINDPSYRKQAQKLSEIHKDQPDHPVNRTVYWINYILRHNGAQHLRAAVYTVSFYQYFLLDIAIVVLLGTSLLCYILARIAKFICKQSKHLWSTDEHITINGHYQNGIPNGKYRRNGHIKHEKKVK